jgi:pyrimidine-nucleoside phosphorylase
MHFQELIARKRDGGRLTPAEWRVVADEYAAGRIADYQMSAFLMAAYLNGLDREETSALTRVMLESGSSLRRDGVARKRADKHSTGGVGDKVSLVLAPLIASLGVEVPMMSGRALGHTGGTLDKLEAIPGFRTRLTLAEVERQLNSVGCAMIGQTDEIAPIDRRLYALRDATATIDSLPLIAASIMSKKLAEGLSGLVLDIKRGSGAFLTDLDEALALARLMIALGEEHDCPVVALLTAMDRPLGRACGNALELEEAIHALEGEGPPDLMKVTFALGAEMLLVVGAVESREQASRQMEVSISSGKALAKFRDIVAAQGGDPAVVDQPARLPQAHACEFYTSPGDGVVSHVEPRAIGRGVIALGGGRHRVEDTIDPSVGFVISARPGDVVHRGEPIATIFARDDAGIATGMAALREAIVIAEEADPPLPLISHRVTAAGAEVVTADGDIPLTR